MLVLIFAVAGPSATVSGIFLESMTVSVVLICNIEQRLASLSCLILKPFKSKVILMFARPFNLIVKLNIGS